MAKSKYSGASKRKQKYRKQKRQRPVTFTPLSEPAVGRIEFAPAFTHDMAELEERFLAAGGKVYEPHPKQQQDPYSVPLPEPSESMALKFQAANGGTIRDARKWVNHANAYSSHSFRDTFRGWDRARSGSDHTVYGTYSNFDAQFSNAMHKANAEYEQTIELEPGKDFHREDKPAESRERPAHDELMKILMPPGPVAIIRVDGDGNVIDVPGVQIHKVVKKD